MDTLSVVAIHLTLDNDAGGGTKRTPEDRVPGEDAAEDVRRLSSQLSFAGSVRGHSGALLGGGSSLGRDESVRYGSRAEGLFQKARAAEVGSLSDGGSGACLLAAHPARPCTAAHSIARCFCCRIRRSES